MARIRALEKEYITNEARLVYEEIENTMGRVPNIFKTYAHHPPLLKANWEKLKAVMMGGSLRRELKEAIALVVSDVNACRYCIAAHGFALQKMGFSNEKINAILKNMEGTGFNPKEIKLLQLAQRSARDANSVTDGDIALLRDIGWSESEIVEAQGVMELFMGFNKFVDSLGVDVDF